MNQSYRFSSLSGFLRLCCFGAVLLLGSQQAFAQGMMTEREIQDQYRRGLDAYKQRNYEKASQLFFDLLENASSLPKYQRLSRYQLARTLYRQKLHLVSLRYVIDFLKKSKKVDGPFIRSLYGLLKITEKIGDETLIIQMIGQVPILRRKPKKGERPLAFIDNLERRLERLRTILKQRNDRKKLRRLGVLAGQLSELRAPLLYFIGRRYFVQAVRKEDGRLFSLSNKFLRGIPANASKNYFAKALFLRATAFATLGRNKLAIKAFSKILGLPLTKGSSKARLAGIKESAQQGIAQAYYALGYNAGQGLVLRDERLRPKEVKLARTYYIKSLRNQRKLPKKRGIFQAKVLFETAWAYFMMGEYHFALGQLLGLQSPYYRINFFPELQILRALIYYQNCKYEDTKQTLARFNKKYAPLKTKLKALIAKRKISKWRLQYYSYLLEQSKLQQNKQKTELPASVLEVLRQSKELKNFEALLIKLSKELSIIRSKGSSWKESNLGKALQEAAGNFRIDMKNRAGDSIFVTLKRDIYREVNGLLTQAKLIKIESLRQQKTELLRYAEGGGIEQDEYPYTIVTEQTHMYWPYQNEYWRDEVGYYRQFIQGECKK